MQSILQDVWREISVGSHLAFRAVIPKPYNRIPITWTNWPNVFVHLIPLIFMAYLVRRPNTYLIRMLLLPTIVMTTLRSCYGYMVMEVQMNVYNWGLGLLGLAVLAKAIDFALVFEGRKKIGETVPGQIRTAAIALELEDKDKKGKKPETANGDADTTEAKVADETLAHRPGEGFLPVWFEDAIEILCAVRGFGWDFGEGVQIPHETRPVERKAFLLSTLAVFQANYVLLDFLESCIKLVPGVGSPLGGSMYIPTLPPVQRYGIALTIHIFTGIAFMAGFRMMYSLATLIAVGLLGHKPASWPPILDNPWASQSLHEFWARRWHQLLRNTFLVFGGYPGQRIAGRVGLVMGSFIASGLYHEFSCYAMGRGYDPVVPMFFALQGFAVLLEAIFRRVTGRRVGGFLGRVWVYFNIMILGQPCVDSWMRRGLGGGIVIPPFISPTRQIIFPLILKVTGR